MVFGAGV